MVFIVQQRNIRKHKLRKGDAVYGKFRRKNERKRNKTGGN
ncbi:MAG: hypothetical protein HFJ34_03570 [Clostridia bacterium]|nr:hypothetical protein [Clostridia bacterium]